MKINQACMFNISECRSLVIGKTVGVIPIEYRYILALNRKLQGRNKTLYIGDR